MTNRLMNSGVKTTAFSENNIYMSLPRSYLRIL